MYLSSDKCLTVNLTLDVTLYIVMLENVLTTSLKNRLLDRVLFPMDCDEGIYTRFLYCNCPLRMHSSPHVLVMGLCSPETEAPTQN